MKRFCFCKRFEISWLQRLKDWEEYTILIYEISFRDQSSVYFVDIGESVHVMLQLLRSASIQPSMNRLEFVGRVSLSLLFCKLSDLRSRTTSSRDRDLLINRAWRRKSSRPWNVTRFWRRNHDASAEINRNPLNLYLQAQLLQEVVEVGVGRPEEAVSRMTHSKRNFDPPENANDWVASRLSEEEWNYF